MNNRIAPWRRRIWLALSMMLLLALFAGCSQSPSSSGVAAGDDAETIEDFDDPSPVPLGPPVNLDETGQPEVSAGNLQIADSNVLVLLNGAVATTNGEPPKEVRWTKVSGPAVQIADDDRLTGAIVIPDLTEPAQLRFKLAIWQTDDLPNAAATTVMVQPQATFARVVGGYAAATQANAQFTIRLSNPQSEPLEVFYRTLEDSAVAYVDFIPVEGSVLFAPGETEKTVPVQLLQLAENDSFRSLGLQIQSLLETGDFVNRGVYLLERFGLPDLEQSIGFAQPELTIRTGEIIFAELDESGAPGAGNVYYISQRPAVASIDALGMITGNNSGETVISAYKAADAQYRGAVASFNLRVSPEGSKPQVLEFTELEIPPLYIDQTFSNPLLVLEGTDNPIAYSVSDDTLATVDDQGRVTPLAPGRVTVTARVPGDVIYDATSASYFLDIEQYPLSLSLVIPDLEQTLASGGELAVLPGQEVDLVLVEESPARVLGYDLEAFETGEVLSRFSIENSATDVATVGLETRLSPSPATGEPAYIGLHVTPIAEGIAEITLTRAADYFYPETTLTLYISASTTPLKSQTIAFTEPGPLTVTAGETIANPLIVEGEGSGAIVYTTSDTSVATVDAEATVQTLRAGEVTVTATKAGDDEFLPASAQYQLLVTLAPQTLVFTYPLGTTLEVGETYTNPIDPALSNAPGSSPLVYASADPAIATVDALGDVTALAPGETTISVTKASDGRYAQTSAAYPLTVESGPVELIEQTLVFELLGDQTLTLGGALNNPISAEASDAPGAGPLIYSSSAPGIVAVDATGRITGLAVGTAEITADKAADAIYAAASSSYVVEVFAPDPLPQSLVFSIPGDVSLIAGETYANPVDPDASIAPGSGALTYTSSASDVASVDAAGTVSALAAGTAVISATKAGDDVYEAAQASFEVTVSAAANQLTFATANPGAIVVGATLANPATSNTANTEAIVYTSAAPEVVTVDASGTLTALAAGVTQITASQASDSRFAEARASYSITVNVAANRLTFTITEPAPLTVGAELANPAVSSTASTGLISYVSSNADVVTVDADGLVTAVAVGAADITATQAADDRFAAASASYSLTVVLAPQQLVFSVPGAAQLTTGETLANPVDTEASNAPGTGALSYLSSDPATAAVDASGLVTALQPGNAIITAIKAGDDRFAEARATYSLTVVRPDLIAQTLVFAEADDVALEVDETYANPIDLEASSAPGSGALTYSSSDDAVATVDANGTVTATAPGSATIVATIAADDVYDQASASYQVTVTPGANSLNFALADPETLVAGTQLNNPATSSSQNSSTILYTSSVPEVASVDANGNVTALIAGETVITATQAADDLYLQASASYALTVTRAAQQLVFTFASVDALSPGETLSNPIDNEASSAPGSAPILYSSSDPLVAEADAIGTVTALLPGTAIITASKAADDTYAAASASYNVAVVAIEQTLVFTEPGDLTVAVAESYPNPIDLEASDAPGTGALSYASSDDTVVEVNETGTITALTPGVAEITAAKAADAIYAAAEVSYQVTVTVAGNQLSFADSQPGPLVVGQTLANPATGNTPSTGAISYTSSAPEVATVDANGTVTGLIAGDTVITATQASDGLYAEASASYPLAVTRAAQQLVFAQIDIGALTVGDTLANPIDEAASDAPGSAPILYSSSDPLVAEVDAAGTVAALLPGTAVITANKAADEAFAEASASYPVTVIAIDQTLVFSTPGNLALAVGDILPNPIDPQASDAPGSGAITYNSADASVATVDANGTLTGVAPGVTTITASKAGDAIYNPAVASYEVTVTVGENQLVFAIAEPGPLVAGGSVLDNPATSLSGSTGAITYETSFAEVATVDANGRVTAGLAGGVTITATQAADGRFEAASASYPLTVERRQVQLVFTQTAVPVLQPGDSFANPVDEAASGVTFVTIIYQSSDPTVADVEGGGLVTATGAGTAVITATLLEDDIFAEAQASFTVTVERIGQQLVFLQGDAIAVNVDEVVRNPVDAQASDAPGTGAITYVSSDNTIASVDQTGIVSGIAPGTVTVTATKAADAVYQQASASFQVTVNRIANTVVFEFTDTVTITPGSSFRNGLFSLTQSDGAFSYSSSNPEVATVDPVTSQITGIAPGLAIITGTQAATAIYAAASATYPVQVRAINTLSFPNPGPVALVVGDTFQNVAQSSVASTGEIRYTTSDPDVASVNANGVVTALGIGTAVISANQQATGTVDSGVGSYEVRVRGENLLSIAVTDEPMLVGDTRRYDAISIYLSDGAITYSSSNPAVAQIASNGQVTALAPGTTTITIVQAATDEYESARLTTSIRVLLPNSLEFGVSGTVTIVAGSTYTARATSSSSSPAPITYQSSDASIARVNANGVVTGVDRGVARITALQAASGDFAEAFPASYSVNVILEQPLALSESEVTLIEFGATNVNFTANTEFLSGMSPITVTSSNPDVATAVYVSGEGRYIRITADNPGETVIRVARAANNDYRAASTTIRVTVIELIIR